MSTDPSGSAASGLGAQRRCDMKDGKTYVEEKIIGYEPQSKMVVTVTKGNMPLKSAIAEISFHPEGPSATRVRFAMTFEPKGIMGHLMAPMMKTMMRKVITNVLAGNADYLKQPAMAEAA